jgi:DNA repair protein RadC
MEYRQSLKILSLAEEDRPREKLLMKGKSALSDAELLGILLGSGTVNLSAVDLAKIVLQDVGNDLNELAKLSVKDLEKHKGIGEAKAIAIVSALELGRRRKESEPVKRLRITASRDAYEIMKPHLMDLTHEEFWVILLSRSNRVLRTVRISAGGVTGTVADPKMIFKQALGHRACGLILVHNHPSGNLTPSHADRELTRKLKEAGNWLEIPVLDHLIFADRDYFSFADEGIL